jgi:hypothetical protein
MICRTPRRARRIAANMPSVALADVRYGAHCGLMADMAPLPERANCRHLGQFHLTGSDRYPRFRVSNFAQSPSIER